MKRLSVFWLAILLATLALFACDSSEEIKFEGPDGNYDDAEIMEFMGTSSTGGNPNCIVVLGFQALDDPGDLDIGAATISLNHFELTDTDGVLSSGFGRESTDFTLGSEQVQVASLTPQAGVDWRTLVVDGVPMTLTIPINGDTVTIEFGAGISFVFDENETPWDEGETYGYVLGLPLEQMIEHAEEPEVAAKYAALYRDTNRNGVLDDNERGNGNIVAQPPNADPADGDEPDGDDPDGDEPDGDIDANDIPLACRSVQPVINIPNEMTNPEPLNIIHLEAAVSGDECGPYQYYWEWAEGGKPEYAEDAILIASNGSFDDPQSIMGQWTNEDYPKIFFPISGSYKFRLKARNTYGVESGPTDSCQTCAEWSELALAVKPSERLHVELVWDRGENTDMDLFLVRLREDGTMGTARAFHDRLQPSRVSMPTCTSDADCFGGLLSCNTTAGECINACTTDADCTAIDRGWECNGSNQCEENADGVIPCDTDADCGDGYCNPGQIDQNTFGMICTKHEGDALNDTCAYINNRPRWGGYDAPQLSCTGDADCNGTGESIFVCDNGICDFGCTSHDQCLSMSEQFVCDATLGECLSNDTRDDPTLDIDDVNGWGPENISLDEPLTGRYRVVVRLYADPNHVVGDDGPLSPVTAFVSIYINGELATTEPLTHEFAETGTYWKVADIVWDATVDSGDGYADPICAGFTKTECASSEDCLDQFGDDYLCIQREWGKFCSTCAEGEGTPDECNPTDVACTTDADCAGTDATVCADIVGDYCGCPASDEFNNFISNPYANPFVNGQGSSQFDPHGDIARSIWCDSADATTLIVGMPGGEGETSINILSGGAACSTLYSK